MYYNHNLRTNLQEWKSRLYRATSEQFGHQIKYLFANIESNKQLLSLIEEAVRQYAFDKESLSHSAEQMETGRLNLSFANETEHASFCYQILKYIIELDKTYELHRLTFFDRREFEAGKKDIVENFLAPILYYFHDKLEKASSVIYLLEKYKKRSEWFTSISLWTKYCEADKNYEQIFEDDLRLFLFDQGIDYPFSTPKTPSGRADIIGAIDTSDPLVVEIKIFDRTKGYGKNRIVDGLSQIIKYANDYNKDVGYLVIFNTDKAEISFAFQPSSKTFPASIVINHKTYYFIIINLNQQKSASKIGATEVITFTEEDLTK